MRPGPLVVALAALGVLAARATAQDTAVPPRWGRQPVVLPDFGGQLDLGLWLGAAIRKPTARGPYPHAGEIRAWTTIGITGSRTGSLAFSAPGLWRDWRVLGLVRSERLLRTPYFGVDNGARQQDSLQEAHGNLYYRNALLRSTAYATVQRRLTGPVWLLVGAQARAWRASSLRQQPSLYAGEVAAGRMPRDTIRFRGLEGRVGVLYDSRDEWVVPTRGVFLELIGAAGTLSRNDLGGRSSYQRVLAGAREFLTLGRAGRTVLALRQRTSLAADSLPFFLAWERLTSWMPEDGIFGGRSVRLHGGGDQLATNEAAASVELRRKLVIPLDGPQDRALWGLGFVDVGALWEPKQATGGRRYVWALGVGARLQMNRTSLVGIDFGMTDLGPNLSAVSYFGF